MKKYDIVTIGGATQDITFYTDELMVIDNPKKDPLRKKLAAFEYGAKIPVREIFVGRGGGATNTASTFASLGLKAATLLRVGNDKEGKAVIADLKSKGIQTKSRLAVKFVMAKLQEYESLRDRLAQRLSLIEKEDQIKVAFVGPEIMKDFIDVVIRNHGLNLVLDGSYKHWTDLKEVSPGSFDIVLLFD